jgi:transposase
MGDTAALVRSVALGRRADGLDGAFSRERESVAGGRILKGEQPMTELCREFGVSRKTAYKWLARYNAEGPGGLADRSRAPHAHPSRVDQVVVEALGQARRSHPHWGARKILAWLERKQPQLDLPVASTVSTLFGKYGLSRSRRARRRTPPYTDPLADADAPNRVRCAADRDVEPRTWREDAGSPDRVGRHHPRSCRGCPRPHRARPVVRHRSRGRDVSTPAHGPQRARVLDRDPRRRRRAGAARDPVRTYGGGDREGEGHSAAALRQRPPMGVLSPRLAPGRALRWLWRFSPTC